MNDKMTQTEETEIKNYLENIKSMRFLADKLNEKYFDERVSKYVINAMIDARNVIESLTEFISNNLDLFFDIKKLKPSESFSPTKFKEYPSNTFSFWVDGLMIDLRIQSRAVEQVVIDFRPSFSVARWGVEVVGIRPYNKKGEWSIGTDLVYTYSSLKDEFIDVEGKHSVTEWNRYKEMADNTRRNSERVIAHFKEYLKEKYEKFKQLAEEREKMLHKNLKCPAYQKVSI